MSNIAFDGDNLVFKTGGMRVWHEPLGEDAVEAACMVISGAFSEMFSKSALFGPAGSAFTWPIMEKYAKRNAMEDELDALRRAIQKRTFVMTPDSLEGAPLETLIAKGGFDAGASRRIMSVIGFFTLLSSASDPSAPMTRDLMKLGFSLCGARFTRLSLQEWRSSKGELPSTSGNEATEADGT